MISCFNVRKWTERAERERLFMENGRLLLEELVASCDGKCNPIRSFSAEELKKATNNYDRGREIVYDGDYIFYSGVLQDRPVSIKRYKGYEERGFGLIGSAITDIVIGSQMSAHNNVLKLLGCCLETVHPTIVYEFVGNKPLSNFLFDTNGMDRASLSWKRRIKIAMSIANGVAYLHTALSRPVIHRDIRPETIIIDQDFDAKLIDFSLSIAIPDGQSHVEDVVRGRMGYSAPEYVCSGLATEKIDVFSFGILLFQIFTGQKDCGFDHHIAPYSFTDGLRQCIINGQWNQIADATILEEGIEQQELLAFATLAVSCIREEAEDRPTMIHVAKELKQIYGYQSVPLPSLPTS